MQWRSILDGVLTANETVEWLKRKEKHGALLKIDFKKAYHLLRWSFLRHMLIQIGPLSYGSIGVFQVHQFQLL